MAYRLLVGVCDCIVLDRCLDLGAGPQLMRFGFTGRQWKPLILEQMSFTVSPVLLQAHLPVPHRIRHLTVAELAHIDGLLGDELSATRLLCE